MSRAILLCLAALAVWAGPPSASQVAKEARKAERSGDTVRAYLLYSQAAALDPKHSEYWAHALALRTRATLDAKVVPPPAALTGLKKTSSAPEAPPPPGFSTRISDEELAELRRIKPPPELKALPGTKTLDLHGDARALFDQAARAFGLGTAFDNDFEGGRSIHLHLEDVDYRDALHAVEAATSSFVFPIGQRLIMVVKDTPQKRTEREPTLAVTVPVPLTVTPQEAQEVGRAVQMAMEIQRLAVDTNRHMVLIKDRISKIRPAQALFEQLAHTRPQVMIDLDFLEVDRSNMLSYGLLGPTQFPITYLGRSESPNLLQSLSQFFVGHSIFGLGIIGNFQLFATLNQSYSKTLLSTQLRALDGEAASFHVGDKYPVTTGGFLGGFSGALPSFNFEDLGVLMKVTPHVHGTEEVSLDVDAELKVLSGQSLNGVPLISTRKLESKVRLKEGEYAVLAGLLNNSDTLTLSGPPLVIRLPFVRKTDHNRTSTEVLLLMRPRLVNGPPDESLTRTLWLGSDGRLEIPL